MSRRQVVAIGLLLLVGLDPLRAQGEALLGGDALERLEDAAPLYAMVRPVALGALLKRLRLDELEVARALRRQLGGLDPFDARLLAPTGLDVDAAMGFSLFEPLRGGSGFHHRAVATLRDPSLLGTFLGAVAVSGQLPGLSRVDPSSPAGRKGVLAEARWEGKRAAIVRVEGAALIVDMVDPLGGAAFSTELIARRFPTRPARRLARGAGARRLLDGEETALALYVEGKRALALGKTPRGEGTGGPRSAKQRAACQAEWARMPAVFGDAALALTADRGQVELGLAWGSTGRPRGPRLRWNPVEESPVDVTRVGHEAPMVVALHAADLSGFRALPRPGAFRSMAQLSAAAERCPWEAPVSLAVGSWPLAVATALQELAASSRASDPLGGAIGMIGSLRTLVWIWRGAAERGRFGAAASFESGAAAALQALLGNGDRGDGLKDGGYARLAEVVGALPPLGVARVEGGAPLRLWLADSASSLTWLSERRGRAMSDLPLAELHLDLPALLPLLAGGDVVDRLLAEGLRLLTRLGRIDGRLAWEAELLRFTVRAPLKP